MKISSILKIPRTEEGCPKQIVRKQPLRDRLRDGALPRSGQPIQPIDGGLAGVPCPEFDPVQNDSTCSFETTFSLAVSKLGPLCAAEIIEGGRLGY